MPSAPVSTPDVSNGLRPLPTGSMARIRSRRAPIHSLLTLSPLCALLAHMRIDVHQHLWSEPLVAALAQRRSTPCVRRDGQAWRLRLPAEPPCAIDVAGDDPARRAALLALDGVDGALIALSTALGVEGLDSEESE